MSTGECGAPSSGKSFSATALLPGATWRKKKEINKTTKPPKSLIQLLLGCSERWDSPRYGYLAADSHHARSKNERKPYKWKLDTLYLFKLCFNAEVRMKSMFSQRVGKRQNTTGLKVWFFVGFFFSFSFIASHVMKMKITQWIGWGEARKRFRRTAACRAIIAH